ncbi:MAG: hypothetical protein GX375_03290 [Clostridiales bacterium]|nr:hypothetical protein [Clostridiales bacterium]
MGFGHGFQCGNKKDESILFFFLLLVIIFCNCGLFDEGDELLFFFLLLVVLFFNDNGARFFGAEAEAE